jgi:hypothetical protein
VTQKDRVLAALRRRKRGITQLDFDLPDVVDAGAPVKRVAARIEELRRDGHRIINAGRLHKCTVYRLIEEAVEPAAPETRQRATPPAPTCPAPQLLEPLTLFEAA